MMQVFTSLSLLGLLAGVVVAGRVELVMDPTSEKSPPPVVGAFLGVIEALTDGETDSALHVILLGSCVNALKSRDILIKAVVNEPTVAEQIAETVRSLGPDHVRKDLASILTRIMNNRHKRAIEDHTLIAFCHALFEQVVHPVPE